MDAMDGSSIGTPYFFPSFYWLSDLVSLNYFLALFPREENSCFHSGHHPKQVNSILFLYQACYICLRQEDPVSILSSKKKLNSLVLQEAVNRWSKSLFQKYISKGKNGKVNNKDSHVRTWHLPQPAPKTDKGTVVNFYLFLPQIKPVLMLGCLPPVLPCFSSV